MVNRRHLIGISAASLVANGLFKRSAQAQAWPSRFPRLVVPYVAGGPTDFIARMVAERLAKTWGHQVVIENRGGAGTNIAAEFVARSNPDGHTMLLGSAALAINRHLYRTLNYDALADLAPVSLLCSYSFLMLVPKSSPAKSVKEFIAFAKENKGKVTFGSPGVGTPPHLCGELFKRMAGIEMTHVPYRGAADALNDLITGRINLFFSGGATIEQVRSGHIRALAVSGAKREAIAPDLPTIAEAGLPGYDVPTWFAVFVPAHTPAGIVTKMSTDIRAALADPVVKGKLEQAGYTVSGSSPEELGTLLRTEIDKWGPVLKEAGLAATQ
jgi:tripartite-type tricarboxylate transporter receptor subunit TctC